MCPWYRARASSRGIPGKKAVALSRERWSTKRGKPGQLAPRVHLCLIQCIISTPPPPSPPSRSLDILVVWLTKKRCPISPAKRASIRSPRCWISISFIALRLDPPESDPRNLSRRLTADDGKSDSFPGEGAHAINQNSGDSRREAH